MREKITVPPIKPQNQNESPKRQSPKAGRNPLGEMDFYRWIVQVVLRPEQTQGFVLLKKRWVVERTFGWLMGCRRLVRDYELLPETSLLQNFTFLVQIALKRQKLSQQEQLLPEAY